MKFLLIFILVIFGCQSKENLAKKSCKDKKLSGLNKFDRITWPKSESDVYFCGELLYIGNEPLASLVLKDESGNFFIVQKKSKYKELLKLQNQIIKIHGVYYRDNSILPTASGSIEVLEYINISQMN